jgi:hypothetical protein
MGCMPRVKLGFAKNIALLTNSSYYELWYNKTRQKRSHNSITLWTSKRCSILCRVKCCGKCWLALGWRDASCDAYRQCMPRIPYASTTQAKVSPLVQVPTRCEARLSSQPPTVWAIFGCPRKALRRQRMRCTGPSRHARMAIVFCRWPRFDVGVKGGIAVIVKCTSIVLCWTWTYNEREKKKIMVFNFADPC